MATAVVMTAMRRDQSDFRSSLIATDLGQLRGELRDDGSCDLHTKIWAPGWESSLDLAPKAVRTRGRDGALHGCAVCDSVAANPQRLLAMLSQVRVDLGPRACDDDQLGAESCGW